MKFEMGGPILPHKIYAPVAQLEERLASNQQVAGSSPAGRTPPTLNLPDGRQGLGGIGLQFRISNL